MQTTNPRANSSSKNSIWSDSREALTVLRSPRGTLKVRHNLKQNPPIEKQFKCDKNKKTQKKPIFYITFRANMDSFEGFELPTKKTPKKASPPPKKASSPKEDTNDSSSSSSSDSDGLFL